MAPARNAVPRSLLPLLILLAAAVAWLLLAERRQSRRPGGEPAEATAPAAGDSLAAPADALFPIPSAAVRRLDVSVAGRGFSLVRGGGEHWRLSGDVVDDVDSASVRGILAKLRAETAVALPPGGEGAGGDLAELGLSGPSATTVRVESAAGPPLELTLGAFNPVLERSYATGAGRPGVFTVATSLTDLLRSLPEAVRLRWLWPTPAAADVETLALRPAGAAAADVFARDPSGHWWVRAAAEGRRRAGEVFAAYDRLYGDRRRQAEGATWWRAGDRAIANVIFQLGDTQVRRFSDAQAAPESLRALGLAPDPQAARIALRGGTRRSAQFGIRIPGGECWARRDERPGLLVITAAGPAAAGAALATLLDVDALPFALEDADSLRLERPGRPGTIRAWRDGKKWRLAGAAAAAGISGAGSAGGAVTTTTAATTSEPAEGGPHPEDILADLVTTLLRLPITRPLPPAQPGRDPLAPPYRAILTAWLPGQGAEMVQIGLLAAAGAGAGAATGGEQPAACWAPATGRLVEVPREILVTLKGMFLAMGMDKP